MGEEESEKERRSLFGHEEKKDERQVLGAAEVQVLADDVYKENAAHAWLV